MARSTRPGSTMSPTSDSGRSSSPWRFSPSGSRSRRYSTAAAFSSKFEMKKSDRKLIRRYRVDDGGKFRLKEHDPADTAGLVLDKDEARRLVGVGVESLPGLPGKILAGGP